VHGSNLILTEIYEAFSLTNLQKGEKINKEYEILEIRIGLLAILKPSSIIRESRMHRRCVLRFVLGYCA
jgi:hypothetical protein